MPTRKRLNQNEKLESNHRRRRSSSQDTDALAEENDDETLVQRALLAPQTLSSHDVLQLQRTIGNRAVGKLLSRSKRPGEEPIAAFAPRSNVVVQSEPGHRNVIRRLVYTADDKKLHVPPSYTDQKIPWNSETKYQEDRAVKDSDPTLGTVYSANGDAFNRHMQGGIGHEVSAMIKHELNKDDAGAFIDSLVGKQMKKAERTTTGLAIKNELLKHNQFLLSRGSTGYWDTDQVAGDVKPAMLPADYIPQTPDLPGAGTSLQSARPGGMGAKWYEYACVLIALVKQEGYPKVAEISKKPTRSNIHAAVQDLHDYYKGKGIEYDDSSTRRVLMTEWGYKLIFSGPIAFTDLRKHINLQTGGKYIFDITGHTVKVTVKKEVPKDNGAIADVSEYLEFHSEEDNYDKDESAQQILYIFEKG